MAKFDRYLLSRLMVLFGFFALVLVSVYWVNQAVILFEQLISDGHSAGVFLEFTALSLPGTIARVLPLSAFVAALYLTQRLISDSELTVVQATGYSPWRLARPVIYFGAVVATMMMILTHLLVPQSLEQLRLREAEISNAASARLLREGVFLSPSSDLTFYIRDITDTGELRDIFLSDRRQTGREVTYTAERAFVVGDTPEEANIVMMSGLAQTLDLETGRLSTTTFADLTYSVSSLIDRSTTDRQRLESTTSLEMLTDFSGVMARTGDRPAELLAALFSRIQQPLLAMVAASIGFATLLTGEFSRFGVTRQMFVAVGLVVLVYVFESAVQGPSEDSVPAAFLIFVPSVVGFSMTALLLRSAARPRKPGKASADTNGAPA
ncbi:putative permease YjgP/YjgQ family protein [Roseivivax sp. THAF40]|uniref:LPS export ABC transporter permease LptF n=1 Tax=unclassified Roseivivax TaxID=2639302 RepID=UPI0012A8ADA6|nr:MULTISPECIES: LPS export ABC transporter permease LptF [unclassified Roseivivax]QFS82768.1 putative permease YjgP/YjgQ family protein [Roseivivax sp. THAF197b]QFT46537.1 putative permease YjgP/YjgQ family protein [Roseivivax sp. THAF40]